MPHSTHAAFCSHGGSEMIEWMSKDVPTPGSDEVVIEHAATGLNLVDIYYPKGLCPAEIPSECGLGATGRIVAPSDGVTSHEVGDRVAYMGAGLGGIRSLYADEAVLMTQRQEKIEGAGSILSFLKRLSDAGATVTLQLQPEENVVQNGHSPATAKYRVDIDFPDAKPTVAVGRFYLVYRWQDGTWQLWRDMDNAAPDLASEDFE